jgi:hypothetical protein
MAQQESEDCVVPQGRRKPSVTRGVEPREGGKAVPVKEADQRQQLLFATAENARVKRGAEGALAVDRSTMRTHKVPKAKGKQRQAGPATMEEAKATHHRPSPHSPGCQPANGMAPSLRGAQVPVGPEP